MKQTLVIGSSVIDVVLAVPRLPLKGEDVNITSSLYRLGGCAYNVYKTLRSFESPVLLCSPVGSGAYGSMVRECFTKEGIVPFINLEEENGCCYCLVEEDGERSFLSFHGAEYFFSRSWMKDIDYTGLDSVFVCGLEVEEPTGTELVEYVCEHPELELYFAPGPRIMHIAPDRMEKILKRRPVLHLNETEAAAYAGKLAAGNTQALPGVEKAAELLAACTGNVVVITLSERGCYYYSPHNAAGESGFVPGFPVVIQNTLGAGDAHCGAFIASYKQGKSLNEACTIANRTASAVVGATFPMC